MNQLNNKMDFKEIVNFLKNINQDVDEFAYGDFPKELGEIKEVYSQGGSDRGSDWERVYHFINHDVFISFSGYYSSYNGVDFDGWDDVNEVRPKEKTITVYE